MTLISYAYSEKLTAKNEVKQAGNGKRFWAFNNNTIKTPKTQKEMKFITFVLELNTFLWSCLICLFLHAFHARLSTHLTVQTTSECPIEHFSLL